VKGREGERENGRGRENGEMNRSEYGEQVIRSNKTEVCVQDVSEKEKESERES
jgi:hypothetical protein